MAPMKDALSQQFPAMASGDQEVAPKGTDMEEERASKEPQLMSVDPQNLPGYLPWEQDLEMMSKFLDRKVNLARHHACIILFSLSLFSHSIGRID